jgi:hypothetical protein
VSPRPAVGKCLRCSAGGSCKLVSVDAYRDADNAAGYRDALRAYRRIGKPVAITEFGCCTYHGAAHTDPHRDLDLASYGVVRGPGPRTRHDVPRT